MPNVYVRNDGTSTTLAAATSPDSPSTALNWTFMLSLMPLMTSEHVVFITDNGGKMQSSSSNNALLVSGLTIIGLSLYAGKPIILDMTNGGQFRMDAVLDTTLKNFKMLYNNNVSEGVNYINGGAGHRTFDVWADNTSNQAFQHESTCEVTHNNPTGSNCADDGLSLHDSSVVTVNGGNFYGNADGVGCVGDSTLILNGTRCFGNSEYDFGASDDVVATINDSQFGGAVVAGLNDNGTSNLEFNRTIFHCNNASTITSVDDGCVHMGTDSGTGRSANAAFNSCLFKKPPASKAQLFSRNDAGASVQVNACTFTQGAGLPVYRAIWDLSADGMTINDSIINNALIGVKGSANTVVNNSDFTDCTADIDGSVVNNNPTNSASFISREADDWRLTSGNPLISAGSHSLILDVHGRPYETPDVGCFANTDKRPMINGQRPTT